MTIGEKIRQGKTYLGIELGSTRIKACLTDDTYTPIAEGSYTWENRFENGYWTYSLEDIHSGIELAMQTLQGMFTKSTVKRLRPSVQWEFPQ